MSTIIPLQRANHGTGFRAYGLRGVGALIDPFLGVDHAWMSEPTFPPHSHVGFSAVSYVFLDSETGIANRDSIGTQNLIHPGGLHWTTAGRGIVHEEVPAEPGKTVHSLQIFVGLSAEQRDIEPAALILDSQDIPTVRPPGARIRVPAGSFQRARSPLAPPTNVNILDISLDADAELSVPVAPGLCAFVMPIFGSVAVNGERFDLEDLKLPIFQAQKTLHELKLQAPRGAVKAMVFSGAPLVPSNQ
jgi:redox-sensitive bicupin YhaK (pirin superfamily)